jgi:hypothetical protein
MKNSINIMVLLLLMNSKVELVINNTINFVKVSENLLYKKELTKKTFKNMGNVSSSSSSGISFVGLLTIVFIVLKLTGYITWSWLWVLSPLWISVIIVLIILIIFILIITKDS